MTNANIGLLVFFVLFASSIVNLVGAWKWPAKPKPPSRFELFFDRTFEWAGILIAGLIAIVLGIAAIYWLAGLHITLPALALTVAVIALIVASERRGH